MNRDREFKDTVYEQLSRIGKAVSSPKRLELLDLLCQGPKKVEVLAKETDLSVANTSQHLQILRGASLVESRKEGLYVVYRIADSDVCVFFRSMRMLAGRRLAELELTVQRFLKEREVLETVDREELLERVRRKSVTVIDVRPPEEYEAGHIPGALSIPLKKLQSRLAEIPKDRQIVAYCRGPYCVLAVKAVDILRSQGYKAIRLEDGVPDWRARGFKVATGSNK